MKNDDLISRSALIDDILAAEENGGMGALVAGTLRRYVLRQPAIDAVSRSVFEQIKWERDCAMQQLKDHGIPFGGIAPAVNTREKLIELLKHAPLMKRTHGVIWVEAMGQWLIDNGVTFAKDTNVPSKWISVEDEKPKRRGHYFITYKFAGSDMRFYGEAFWHDDVPDNGYVQGNHFSNEGVDGMYVTHWMVIQELPEPPRVQGVPNGTDHV